MTFVTCAVSLTRPNELILTQNVLFLNLTKLFWCLNLTKPPPFDHVNVIPTSVKVQLDAVCYT